MRPRLLEQLIVIYLAVGGLIAIVVFVKVMLSAMLAVFVAGLGLGALGVLGVLMSTGRLGRQN